MCMIKDEGLNDVKTEDFFVSQTQREEQITKTK